MSAQSQRRAPPKPRPHDTVFLIRQFVLNCTPIHCRLMRLPHLPFPQSAPLGSCRWPAPRTARMRRIAKSDHRTTSFAGQTAQEVTRRPTDSIRRRHLASDIPSQRPDELRMRTMADETRSPMARLRRYAPNDRWSGRKYDGRRIQKNTNRPLQVTYLKRPRQCPARCRMACTGGLLRVL